MESKVIYKIDKLKFEEVLRDKSIPSGAKLVLHNLLFRAGIKNFCFPSQKKIAFDIGLSERQVRNHLALLNNKGIILWSRGAINPKNGERLNSNRYDLSKIMRRTET